ncbi:G-PROTEIN-RECEP-F1-2 domain-containing protein [Aphelenchoides bicaudatus]|nr:G-PROTEIN-RECEP-F1-2 domain-containing protein [Aphelenchoides bicaudatus]
METSTNAQPSQWLKFVRYFTSFINCSTIILFATNVMHVAAEAEEFKNTSDLKRISTEGNAEHSELSPIVISAEEGTIPAHNINNYVHPHEEYLVMWAEVSKVLLVLILVISIVSILVLSQALYYMFTRYKRSVYFDFLTAMIINDLVMLLIIIFSMLTDFTPVFKGRFAYIYSSVSLKRGFLSYFEDSRSLLIYTGIVSVVTQLYVPFLLTESRSVRFATKHSEMDYGGRELLDLYYAFSDHSSCRLFCLAVYTREQMVHNTITQNDSQIPLSLKIQSEESIQAANRRRKFAVKRCLALATTQLCLNLPYHIITLISDFFTHLRFESRLLGQVFLYGEALFYLLYLIQFPLIAVFVRLLHSNYDERRKSKNRRQQRLIDDGHSTLSSYVPRGNNSTNTSSTHNKRCSRELESIAMHRHARITLQNSHQF